MRYEAVAVAKRLGLSFSQAHAAGSGGPDPVELRVVGPRCARLGHVVVPETFRGVVMAGLAGAADPSLRVGDVVVDERSDLPAKGPWRRGAIHTSTDIVATVAQKRAIFRDTGALAIDMENANAREFAALRGVPFLGVRAVSDAADAAIDPATLRWVDDAGALRPGRLMADLCRRPSRVATLVVLAIHSRVAAWALAEAVHQIVASQQAEAHETSNRGVPSRCTA